MLVAIMTSGIKPGDLTLMTTKRNSLILKNGCVAVEMLFLYGLQTEIIIDYQLKWRKDESAAKRHMQRKA